MTRWWKTIRDLTQIQHLNQLVMLVELLRERSGQQVVMSKLAGAFGPERRRCGAGSRC